MLQINNITNKELKDSYTSLEILTSLKYFKNETSKFTADTTDKDKDKDKINTIVMEMSYNQLKLKTHLINDIILKQKLKTKKLKLNNRTTNERQLDILGFVEENSTNKKLLYELFNPEYITNTTLNSKVYSESSSVIITSCNFSPGRIPIIFIGVSGEITVATSTTLKLGILGTNISPPCILDKLSSTN